ncbi:hypothetical protein Pelo_1567 [Pelomyxa schiedti]|nr:hypothetical protein Pelo_1567 [Pelomyxa schiedti]
MTTPPLSWKQRGAISDACVRGDMPPFPCPTWDFNTPISFLTDGTILHIACAHGHVRLARQLLAVGATRSPPIDPNASDGCGMTPLCCAAEHGKEAVVRVLLATSGVDVNKGCPLVWACTGNHMGVVAALLGCPHVDANAVHTSGETALHAACEEGFVEGVKALLQVNGIDTNRKNGKGETPLDVATRRNSTDICNLLRDHNTRRQSPQPTTNTPKNNTFEQELSEKEREIARITGENKRLGESLREMNERVMNLEGKLQEKEKRIKTLEEENSVLKECYKERAETMTSLVGANIDSFAMMKFLGSGSNAATFHVKFFPRGSSSVLLPLLQPSSSSLPPPPPSTTTQPPLPLDNNTKSDEQNNSQPPTMAMKVLFNWENTAQQTLIKQKYMKECIVLASVPLHPNVIHPLGTLVIPRFPPEFIEAIPSDQPVYKEFALNKSLAFLLPFCGVPLPKFLSNMPSYCATATSAASTTTHQIGAEASTTSTVRNLLFQSLSAVAHIERAHVIHRDIKGDNILVDPATHKLTLIDFGEAVECCSADDDDDSLQVMLTRADNGQVWGNTGTMPPEVATAWRASSGPEVSTDPQVKQWALTLTNSTNGLVSFEKNFFGE